MSDTSSAAYGSNDGMPDISDPGEAPPTPLIGTEAHADHSATEDGVDAKQHPSRPREPKTAPTSRPSRPKQPRLAPVRLRNVYVAALPIGFSDLHLAELMGQFGPLTSCRMFNDARRVETVGRSYGFALFERPEDADAAVKGLTGLMIEGRRIQIRLSDTHVVKKTKATRKAAKGLEGVSPEEAQEQQATPNFSATTVRSASSPDDQSEWIRDRAPHSTPAVSIHTWSTTTTPSFASSDTPFTGVASPAFLPGPPLVPGLSTVAVQRGHVAGPPVADVVGPLIQQLAALASVLSQPTPLGPCFWAPPGPGSVSPAVTTIHHVTPYSQPTNAQLQAALASVLNMSRGATSPM